MTVASEILRQLGGNRFRVMTGARQFLYSDNSLQFRLPNNPGFVRDKINCIRITLTPADVYRVEFLRIAGSKITPIEVCDDVYCDTLANLVSERTGLAVSL